MSFPPFPRLSQASPSFLTGVTVCLLQCAFLPGINALARPPLLPIIWRHVCQPAGVWFGVEQSEVAQPEEAGSGTLTCPFSAPQSGTFRTASLNTAPLWPQGLPETFPGLWVSHPGQRNRTVGVPTLSALGRALTCNHSGKQP